MNFFLTKSPHPNTKLLWAVQIFLLALILLGFLLLFTQSYWLPKVVSYILKQEEVVLSSTDTSTDRKPLDMFDLQNAVLIIEGESAGLVDGTSEMLVTSGSAEKVVTRYFGNEAIGDLNSDNKPDVVFLVTQERGGSGMFYYAVAALNGVDGYSITNAVLLGDRIVPQTTSIELDSGEVLINYAERLPGEPMTNLPSVGVTQLLKINDYGLLEKI